MTKLPPSFDPYIIQDELLAALKQSPITSQLLSLRAEEIIQIILEKPIVLSLQEEIRTLKQKLDDEKMMKRTLRSDSKQKYRQQERQVNERQRLIQSLNEEMQMQAHSIEAYQAEKRQMETMVSNSEAKIQELEEYIQQLATSNSQLKNEATQKTYKIGQLQQTIVQRERTLSNNQQQYDKWEQQLKAKIQNLERSLSLLRQQSNSLKIAHQQKQTALLHSHQQQLEQRDQTIQSLKDQRFAVKNQINSLKIDLQEITKLTDSLTDQNRVLVAQRDQLKHTIRTNKIINDKERKSLNQRLYQLTQSYKNYQKLKGRIAALFKTITKLKEQNQKLTAWINEQLKLLSNETTQKTKLLLDGVGKHVDSQLKNLSEKLLTKNQQIKTIKTESKLGKQNLQRSQKQITLTSKQLSDLKSQLRQKKRQQQRLRRQLKSNYEQYESKLSKMQKKYVELLNKTNF